MVYPEAISHKKPPLAASVIELATIQLMALFFNQLSHNLTEIWIFQLKRYKLCK